MRKLLFILFTISILSVNAQGMLVLTEVETESVSTFETVMNKWMGALKTTMEIDDARMIVFREQGSRNLILAQWFDSLTDVVEHMDSQEANNEKIMQAWESSDPLEEGTWEKFVEETDFKENTVWEYMPELSTTPETYSPLSQEEKDEISYRRVQYFSVKIGQSDSFEANRKKFNEMDKSIGVKFHLAVFKSVFGARDADYMVILLDKSRFDYHSNWQARMKVRNDSEAWQAAINNDNLGNWSVTGEANWNRIKSMTY